MPEETEVIKQEVEQFKVDNGGNYNDYYIGITKHIEQRLIERNELILEHLAKGEYTKGNPTYTAECISRDEAVAIEQYFQERGMLKLNPRSLGVEESRFIYCYKMTEENKKAVLAESAQNLFSKNELDRMKQLIDYKNSSTDGNI